MKVFCLYLFSTWIFVASALYPIHKFSTFPLNLLALIGFYETNMNDSSLKNLYNAFLHIGPFLWIPYSFSDETFLFCACLLLIYLITMTVLKVNCYEVYDNLVQQRHPTFEDFVEARFRL